MSELDRLIAAAREAEPEPLGDAAMDALVHNARRSSARATPVERVIEDARHAEPDPLSERELRSMAERAAMTGRARHRRWTRRRVMGASALAATLAAAAVTLFVLERPPLDPPLAAVLPAAVLPATVEPEVAVEVTDLDLPTGDRLVAASGARFHVELPEPRIRRVRLGGGAMLFDVRPIDEGRFSVSTPSAQIVVLGTVFSVQATERATTVWVYEGAVRIEEPSGGSRVVEAGGVLHVGAGEAGADALASAGRDAAARRMLSGPIASAATAPDPIEADVAEPAAERSPPPIEAPREVRSAASVEASPAATSPGAEPASATPADVRALIASGDAARALSVVEDAIGRGELDPWRMLEGDALRVLGRFDDAAAAYQRAARELPAPRRQQAGFLEARVRLSELSDAAGALRALRAAEVTASGSVLRERGMALEVQLLVQLGRRAEAATAAADYLREYPEGPDAETMRARAEAAPDSDP